MVNPQDKDLDNRNKIIKKSVCVYHNFDGGTLCNL